MAKVLDLPEETAVGGAEWLYVIDGSVDKKAQINTLKSIFASTVTNLTALKAYEGEVDGQIVFLLGGTSTQDNKTGHFRWDSVLSEANSEATADDLDRVAVVIDTVWKGNWVRCKDQTYISVSGDAVTGDFLVSGDLDITGNVTVSMSLQVSGQEVWREELLPKTRTAFAWVNATCNVSGAQTSGVPTIEDHYNVSGITDNGAGEYTLNFASAAPDENYAWTGTARTFTDAYPSQTYPIITAWLSDTKTASALKVRSRQASNSVAYDAPEFSVVIFS